MALGLLLAGSLLIVIGILAARWPVITDRIMALTTLEQAIKVFARDRSEEALAATRRDTLRSVRVALPVFLVLFGLVLLLEGAGAAGLP